MNALKKTQVGTYFFSDLTGGETIKVDGVDIDVTANVGVRKTVNGIEVESVEVLETGVVTKSGATLAFEKQSLNRNKTFYAELSKAIDTLAIYKANLLGDHKWEVEDYE